MKTTQTAHNLSELRKRQRICEANIDELESSIWTAKRKNQLTTAYELSKELNFEREELKEIKKQITLRKRKQVKIKKVPRKKKAIEIPLERLLSIAKTKVTIPPEIKQKEISIIKQLPMDDKKIPDWITILSKNMKPEKLKNTKPTAAELFEIYIYKIFTMLSLETNIWGATETRFQVFADGFFLIPNTNSACLYDTKAYSKGYNASSEILKFANYIEEHKTPIYFMKRSKIKFFLIVSSDFTGDFAEQAAKFYQKSAVKLILCKAKDLADFTKSILNISQQYDFLQNLNWDKMLSKANPLLDYKIFEEEIERLKKIPQIYGLKKIKLRKRKKDI